MKNNVYIYIICMALTTYLVRIIPLTLIRKKIKNKFIRSFLYYVPYAVLAAMTFPAVIYSADGIVPGIAGTFTGLLFAYKRKSLLMVAVVSCVAALAAEILCNLL